MEQIQNTTDKVASVPAVPTRSCGVFSVADRGGEIMPICAKCEIGVGMDLFCPECYNKLKAIVDAAYKISLALHQMEGEGINLPKYLDEAWEEFTVADQAAWEKKS